VQRRTHLAELAVALARRGAVVRHRVVTEVHGEGLGARRREAPGEPQEAGGPQVGQPEGLRHGVLQTPRRTPALVGFRQIQEVLPDILQEGGGDNEGERGREREREREREGERERGRERERENVFRVGLKASHSSCVLIGSVINHRLQKGETPERTFPVEPSLSSERRSPASFNLTN